ncbi:hypothetical protein CTAYLR_009355 [Chrysophaeum taylorii]|uniref:Ankyrin repeat-containing domain n=1 Tax=Chrysophaeum taylorii TaxID=2483200 RepID=A0AAD7UKV4_9STRA|nr:hypothetical protein CTAYLR_009355 [Chrysophaeum taylorii]
MTWSVRRSESGVDVVDHTKMEALKRSALGILIELNAWVMLNCVDDEDCTIELKRAFLHAMVEAGEEWLFGLIEGVSDGALRALAQKRIEEQSHLVEISKLFDKVGIEHHVLELLKLMVPGLGYDPEIDENVRLPRGVRWTKLDTSGARTDLAEFIRLGAINWVGWLLCRTLGLGREVFHVAARHGRLEVLQWARANGYSLNEWTCANAATGGHLEVLKWARANDCPWDEWTCAAAARSGHLELLQWARSNGCPWNKTVCCCEGTDEVRLWALKQA